MGSWEILHMKHNWLHLQMFSAKPAQKRKVFLSWKPHLLSLWRERIQQSPRIRLVLFSISNCHLIIDSKTGSRHSWAVSAMNPGPFKEKVNHLSPSPITPGRLAPWMITKATHAGTWKQTHIGFYCSVSSFNLGGCFHELPPPFFFINDICAPGRRKTNFFHVCLLQILFLSPKKKK